MKKSNALKKLAHFAAKPSFTVAEATSKGVSGQSLSYYARKGVLERIAPGIYAFSENDKLDPRWSELIQIIQGYPEASICLITALTIYELTEEIPREYWLAIPHETRVPKVTNCRFIRMRNTRLGKSSTILSGVRVPIFNIERTLVDSFRHLDREVAIKALRLAAKKKIDFKKISFYARKLRINISPYILTVTT